MNTHVLVAATLGAMCPVVAALLVRLWGRPGARRFVRAGLYIVVASVLASACSLFVWFPEVSGTMLGACAVASAVSLLVCLTLLRHRIRAHRLFVCDQWSAEDMVQVIRTVVRYYRNANTEFRLQLSLVANNGEDKRHLPDKLHLSVVDGPEWYRSAEFGWSAEVFEDAVRKLVGLKDATSSPTWVGEVAQHVKDARGLVSAGVCIDEASRRVERTASAPAAEMWVELVWAPGAHRPRPQYANDADVVELPV